MWPVKVLQDAINTLQAAMDKIDECNAKSFDNPRKGGVYSHYFVESLSTPPVGERKAAARDVLVEEMIKDLRAYQRGEFKDEDYPNFSAKSGYMKYFFESDSLLDLSLQEDA